jgi:hypothetical protein
MAHFIGTLKGMHGKASRLGSKNSGVIAQAQGWQIGGEVHVYHCRGKDYVSFSINGGSGNASMSALIKTFSLDALGNIVEVE